MAKQCARPIGVGFQAKIGRGLERSGCGRIRMQRKCTTSRRPQCLSSMQDQLGRCGSSGPFQLERAHVVIREQLGLVLRPTDRLNPFRHSTVLVSTFGTWDLPISDVSYEDMVERVFRLPFDGGAPFTANEVSPDE